MAIDVDDSNFPIVVLRFLGRYTDDEFAAYLDRTEAIMHRRAGEGRYATVLDARQSSMPSSKQARMQADWLARLADQLSEISVGSAFVIGSPVIRGAMKAIMWMQPMPTPHVVVGTMEDAEAWARERLEAAGVDIPDGLRISSRDAAS